jgi:regulator of sigma E protease
MTLLISILSFVLVLSFLVIIHELGHYFFAKLFRVRVKEFGLGYPPRVASLFKVGETLFSLNLIPFGGFVNLEGEDGPAKEKGEAVREKSEGHLGITTGSAFYEKSIFARLLIILAGAAVNFLFGVMAFAIFFSAKGIPTLLPNPRIGEVAQNSPAAQAKIPVNVDIKAVKVKDTFVDIFTPQDVVKITSEHLGEHVTLVTTGSCTDNACDTHLQEFDVYLRKKEETPEGQGALGIRFTPVIIQKFYPWPEMPLRGAIYGTKQALALIYIIVVSLGEMIQQGFQGHVPQEVAGPVGIFTQANKAGFFSNGLFELLNFAGMLSVNLAVMNVLPIPALDGGRALFLILEVFVGKKRIEVVEGYAYYGGLALLLTIIVLTTIKDVGSLFH